MRQHCGAPDGGHSTGEAGDLRRDPRHLGDHDHGRAGTGAEHRSFLAAVGELRHLEVVQLVVSHCPSLACVSVAQWL